MSQDQASATQSVQDNVAQAITYTDPSASQATAAPAPGPAQSASQSANPVLTAGSHRRMPRQSQRTRWYRSGLR